MTNDNLPALCPQRNAKLKKSFFFVGAAFPALSSSKGSRDKPRVIPESVAG